MSTREEHETPTWAVAVLFWRKVEMLERRGIPGIRPEHDPTTGGPKR
jgi:hypothetical protein